MPLNLPFSVVIPVYNEEATIEDVIKNLKDCLNNKKLNYEIVCVNDGSTDNSLNIMKRIPDITLVNHLQNRGMGAAIKSGILAAKHDVIITFDADGQHFPEDIPRLLNEYEKEEDMIIGARKITNTFYNRIPGKIFLKYMSSYLFKQDIQDLNSGLRLFNRKIIKKFFIFCSDRFSFSTSSTLCYYAFGMNVKYVPIETKIREKGKSHVNYRAGLKTIMKIIQIAMIFQPLRVMAPIVLLFLFFTIFSLTKDLISANLSDSTVLFFCVTIILSVFALLSEQLRTIRLEIMNFEYQKRDES